MAMSAMTSMDGFIFEDEDDTLITNFSSRDKGLYQYSIDWYNQKRGSDILFIKEVAYNQYGAVLERCHGLHSNDRGCGLSDFWRFYENANDHQSHKNHISIKKPKKWVG